MRRLPNPASLSPEEREQHRAALVGSSMTCQHTHTGDGSSYYTDERNGKLYAAGFKGKAIRPAFHCRFRNAAERDAHIAQWLADLKASAAAKAEAKAKSKQPHTLQPGAVLYSSWGYDQTNCEFYEVIAVRGAAVDLRELKQTITSTGDMTGFCIPIPGEYISGVIAGKRPKSDNHIRLSSFQGAYPWDGTRKRWSSYA